VNSTEPRSGFFASLRDYWRPGVREMLFLGFACGLPFPMVLTTLSARLRLAGIDRTTIGLFSLVGLAYSMKFVWSPIVDRYKLPVLGVIGQRRGWMLFGQLGVFFGLLLLAFSEPGSNAERVAILATITAFFSATQDIAVDAYRIESVDLSLQGTSSAAYQVGYQVALICSGAGALVMASHGGWPQAYFLIAALLLIGVFTTLRIAEPARHASRDIVADPVLVQATAERLRPIALLIAFLATALLWLLLRGPLAAKGDSTLALDCTFGALALIELALLAVVSIRSLRVARDKLVVSVVLPVRDIVLRYGWRLTIPMLALTLTGAVFAGWFVRRLGFMQSMLLGVLLLSAANLFYGHLATLAGATAPSVWWLAAAISLDNVANGIAGTAFIAYMSSLTTKQYTATQYALFGTLWSLPAKSLASQWGRIVDAFGYPVFFVYTALIAIPAVLLILWLMRGEHVLKRSEAAGTGA
jgi:PAT family beta-lactamase induction signal transducer AmpG